MTDGSIDGKNLIRVTFSSNFGFTTSFLAGSLFGYSFVSMDICWFSILAIGAVFTDLNASLLLVWSFLILVPLWIAMLLSEVVSCIATTTSANGAFDAARTAPNRFVAASELG